MAPGPINNSIGIVSLDGMGVVVDVEGQSTAVFSFLNLLRGGGRMIVFLGFGHGCVYAHWTGDDGSKLGQIG